MKLFGGLHGMRQRMRNATLDGQLIGAKGIENYFRKPFGSGWVLTGDAGYLKDPSTGTGIGDAFQQSVWLADALDDCFKGSDWEERMGAFQLLRDSSMMPMYKGTLSFTKMRDPNPQAIALVKGSSFRPWTGTCSGIRASQSDLAGAATTTHGEGSGTGERLLGRIGRRHRATDFGGLDLSLDHIIKNRYPRSVCGHNG